MAGSIITATSERTGLPGSNVGTAQPSQIWRTVSGVTSADLLIDFGSSLSIGFIYVGNCNLGASGTLRTRLSANSNLTSPTHDSGVVDAGVEVEYRCTFRTFTPVSGRYLGLAFSDGSLPNIDVGKVEAGTVIRPTYNISPRSPPRRESRTYTRSFKSEDGNDYALRGSYQRGISFTLDALTTAEWEIYVEPLIRLSSGGEDVVVCLDPASTNIGRDTYCGPLEELPSYEMDFPGHGSVSFRVWHRL